MQSFKAGKYVLTIYHFICSTHAGHGVLTLPPVSKETKARSHSPPNPDAEKSAIPAVPLSPEYVYSSAVTDITGKICFPVK